MTIVDPKNPKKVYEVKTLDCNTDNIAWAYEIIDAKGRSWKLLRNKPNPKMLFAVPENFVNGPKILDNRWFTDYNKNGTKGELRFVN